MSPPSHRPTLVSEVMTSGVQTAESSLSLTEIHQMLIEGHFHHVPILEGDRLVGMISARDLVRFAREQGTGRRSFEDGTAADAMTSDVETIPVGDPVEAAIERIGKGDIHALAVIGEGDRLAGIVTHRDLLQYLAD